MSAVDEGCRTLIKGKCSPPVVYFSPPLMFELEANKLVKNIETVSYDLEDFYRFGNELLELPFPFVGKAPSHPSCHGTHQCWRWSAE